MKNDYILLFALLLAPVFLFRSAEAQIRIQIPKIPKPEITTSGNTKPKLEQPTSGEPKAATPQSSTVQTTGGFRHDRPIVEGTTYTRPEPTNKPVFLRDTIEVQLETRETYWKFPNQNYYTSWVPRANLHLFYDGSVKLRYTAEWFTPDGSPWFTESLNYDYTGDKTAGLRSDYSDELLSTKAVVTTGTYGLKITNSKTNEVAFQGKFKVNKLPAFPGEAQYKNRVQFFVDNDWNLPIGYVGFSYDIGWANPTPVVFMWFKGRLEAKDFEARLFHNGEEIASTDGDGIVNVYQYRGENCLKFVDTCQLQQYGFYWEKFIVENTDWVRSRKPNAMFTKDKPGDYTVKVFHKGIQVREAKFIIDADGKIARNAFSEQMPLTNHKIVVPVKVMGNLDKWNPTTWKTDAFSGNPLSGFGAL